MRIKFHIFLFVLLVGFGLTQCVSIMNSTDNEVKTDRHLTKEELLRQDIIDYAKKQLGAAYTYAGRDPRGFDCSGFTYYVLGAFDIKVSTSSKSQANEGKKIPVDKVQLGDLIFFKRTRAGKVFHVAMVVSNSRDGIEVIHSTSRGVVIDNISKSKYWNPKIFSARSVVGAAL